MGQGARHSSWSGPRFGRRLCGGLGADDHRPRSAALGSLLFERFLNPERVSMPDFDIDFCQERRGEVIDYVKNKYGEDRVAHIITFGTLQARAVVRDVGRVMQLPFHTVDKFAKLIPANPANPVTLAQALDTEDKLKGDAPETSRRSASSRIRRSNSKASTATPRPTPPAS